MISLKVTPQVLVKQKNTRNANTQNFGGTVTYTGPTGRRSLLEISFYYNTNSEQSDRKTYDYNSGSGKYDQYNTLLSNEFTFLFLISYSSVPYSAIFAVHNQ